jgi:hypothetical protein
VKNNFFQVFFERQVPVVSPSGKDNLIIMHKEKHGMEKVQSHQQ